MTYIEPKNLTEIITYVDATIRQVNDGEISIDRGASRIVGATLANNSVNVRTLYAAHPALEDLAESSADAEVYDNQARIQANPDLKQSVDWLWEDVQDAFKRLRMTTGHVNYREYLHMQSQLKRIYDLHPEFFEMLEEAGRDILEKWFLYATEDDEYPGSLRDFFDSGIAGNVDLQTAMFNAAQKIYTLSDSGDLGESVRNDTSFPSIAD